jgi:hypothetical protein
MQGGSIVDADDAAAANAYLGNIDRRGAQQIPATLVEAAAGKSVAPSNSLDRLIS